MSNKSFALVHRIKYRYIGFATNLPNQFGMSGVRDVILAHITVEPTGQVEEAIVQGYQDVRDER